MDNDLELEGLLFDEEKNQSLFLEPELVDKNDSLSERWAAWINVVNK